MGCIETSIHLEHKAPSYAAKPSSHNKEKYADQPTDSNHSHGSSHKSQRANARDNTQGQFQDNGGRGSLGNHRRGKAANNGRSVSVANSINLSHLTDYS